MKQTAIINPCEKNLKCNTHHIRNCFAVLSRTQRQAAAVHKHIIQVIKLRNELFNIAHALGTAFPQFPHVMEETIRNVKMATLELHLYITVRRQRELMQRAVVEAEKGAV